MRASVKYSAKTFDPFNTLDISAPVESSPEPATDGQISFLAKLRVDATSMSKRQASKLIGAHKRRSKEGLCSFAQAKILKERGYNPDMTREEAKRTIDAIAAREGWGRRG